MMNFGTHKLQLGKTWVNNIFKMLTYLALPIILGGPPGAYNSLYWGKKFTLKDFQKDEFWYTQTTYQQL